MRGRSPVIRAVQPICCGRHVGSWRWCDSVALDDSAFDVSTLVNHLAFMDYVAMVNFTMFFVDHLTAVESVGTING